MLEALPQEISEDLSYEAAPFKRTEQLLLQSILRTYENVRDYYLENPFVNILN